MNKDELDLILVKHRDFLKGTGGERADLRYADLQGADLQYAYLQGAYLQGAKLKGANLQGADLQGADLQGADLRDSYLQYSYLRYAYLRDANLQGAKLKGADLQYADLQYAKLLDADLRYADFSQSNTIRIQGFYSIDNIGSFDGKITYHVQSNQIWAGCWKGSLEEFKVKCFEVWTKNIETKEDLEMCISFFERKSKGEMK